MSARIIIALALALVIFIPRGVNAQSPEEGRLLELVDRLKEVIRRAERSRNMDKAVLEQLRDLVRRNDWPWRVRALFDDFSDGEFIANPAWQVSRGVFEVIPGRGLHTNVGADAVPRPAPSEKEPSGAGNASGGSTIEAIFGGIRKGSFEPPGAGSQFRSALPTAEISTSVALGNAFAVRVRMSVGARNPEGARIEFGPYRGGERDWGYLLAYNSGSQPSFEILRLSPGLAALVERSSGAPGLNDGRAHQIELRRDRNGAMQLLVDGNELMRTVDRGSSDLFDGFTIVNSGGEYSFERIEIFGTER